MTTMTHTRMTSLLDYMLTLPPMAQYRLLRHIAELIGPDTKLVDRLSRQYVSAVAAFTSVADTETKWLTRDQVSTLHKTRVLSDKEYAQELDAQGLFSIYAVLGMAGAGASVRGDLLDRFAPGDMRRLVVPDPQAFLDLFVFPVIQPEEEVYARQMFDKMQETFTHYMSTRTFRLPDQTVMDKPDIQQHTGRMTLLKHMLKLPPYYQSRLLHALHALRPDVVGQLSVGFLDIQAGFYGILSAKKSGLTTEEIEEIRKYVADQAYIPMIPKDIPALLLDNLRPCQDWLADLADDEEILQYTLEAYLPDGIESLHLDSPEAVLDSFLRIEHLADDEAYLEEYWDEMLARVITLSQQSAHDVPGASAASAPPAAHPATGSLRAVQYTVVEYMLKLTPFYQDALLIGMAMVHEGAQLRTRLEEKHTSFAQAFPVDILELETGSLTEAEKDEIFLFAENQAYAPKRREPGPPPVLRTIESWLEEAAPSLRDAHYMIDKYLPYGARKLHVHNPLDIFTMFMEPVLEDASTSEAEKVAIQQWEIRLTELAKKAAEEFEQDMADVPDPAEVDEDELPYQPVDAYESGADMSKKLPGFALVAPGAVPNNRRLTYRLCEMRRAAGLTQAQLSERCGLTQTRISQIENGLDEDVRMRELIAITNGLRCVMVIGLLPEARPKKPL